MIHKKGTSPLVATIVLFVFALTLGFLLINVSEYSTSRDDLCSDIYDVRIMQVNNNPRICQDITSPNKTIRILLENIGDEDIYGLFLTVVGDGPLQVQQIRDYETTIRSSGSKPVVYSIPDDLGTIEQVKISIYQKIGENLYLCKKQSIVVGSIPECS